MLNELVVRYQMLQDEETRIKEEKEQLKESILKEMGEQGIDKYLDPTSGVSATVVIKETFKYTDELSMIKYLEENGYGSYVEKKVSTSLNKVLKTPTVLTESLKPMYTKTVSTSLTVKGN